jgi:23S rRNA pseudouridine1911/1915/1917 synthase
VSETRALPVPDGLAGERVDAALAKLLGFSRTFAAEVAASGGVTVDGRTVGKSDRLEAGAWLDVTWSPREAPAVVAVDVPGMAVVHDDDEIVVVDKPVGVAAHPSVGWTGPTVLGGLAAAGFTVSTSGASERAGIVHRLDVGTSGLMVVAKTERAYTLLKQAFRERTVEKIYNAVVQGHPDPLTGTIDAPIGRHPSSDWKFAVVVDGKPSVPTTRRSRRSRRRRCSRSISRRVGPTRSGSTWRPSDTPASVTRPTVPTRRSRRRSA